MNALRACGMTKRVWSKMARGDVVLCRPLSVGSSGSLNAARRNVYGREIVGDCVIITDTEYIQKNIGADTNCDALLYGLSEYFCDVTATCRIIALGITYFVKGYGMDDEYSLSYNLPVRKLTLTKIDETIIFDGGNDGSAT